MKYLSIIEDFFLGKLNMAELERFRTRTELNSNKELRNEFEIYKKVLEFTLSQEKNIALNVSEMTDFKLNPNYLLDIKKYKNLKPSDEKGTAFIKTLEDENKKLVNMFVFKSTLVKFSKIAAIVFLIVGFGISGIICIPKFTSNNEKLFEKFYSPYEYSIVTRSITKEVNNSIYMGLLFYNNGDYSIALSELSNVADSLIYNDAIFIVEGISLIEVKKYKIAIQKFKLVKEKSLLYTTSLWYQGLCYLKVNEIQSAKQVFNKLRSIEPYYQKKSKRLLRYL